MDENKNNEIEESGSVTEDVTAENVVTEEVAAEGAASETEKAESDFKEAKARRLKKSFTNVFEIIEMVAVCAAVIILVFSYCFRLTIVDGPSMNNTLTDGDYLIIQSLGYEPQRGDIVVLQDPTAEGYNKPLVKRVIAVGGDTLDIDFDTWTVTLNGEVLDESEYRYLAKDARLTSDLTFPVTVPEGSVFVMGDNRNHSADSRMSRIGMIDERCVAGRAVLRLFPINSITIFD